MENPPKERKQVIACIRIPECMEDAIRAAMAEDDCANRSLWIRGLIARRLGNGGK